MTARLMAGLFLLLLFGIASCFLLGTLLWKRRLLLRLQALVDQAIAGTLAEEHFDESRLSALENSLWRYLQGSQASYQKLSEQKQRMEEWISDISHQAVTPLSNILLYSQLLEETLRETAKPDSSCGFSPQQTPSPSSTAPLDTLPEPAPGTPSESSGRYPNPEKPEGICYGLEDVAAIREQAQKLDFFMRALQKLSRLEQGLLSLQPE